MAVESLSWSAWVFGEMAMARSGSGRSIGGSVAVSPFAVNVSPVAAWASLATAPMSPAGTSPTVTWSLPFMANTWPTRSSVLRVALCSEESGRTRPEYTRNRLMRPTNGSDTVLNTRAVSGPFGSHARSWVEPSFVVTLTAGRSSGDGNASAMKAVSRSAPIGLDAAATTTGVNRAPVIPALTPWTICSVDSSPDSR